MYAVERGALREDLCQLWAHYHAVSELESGPLLHPAYSRAVAAVRSDVEVAVIERDGEVQGFVPFQRDAFDVARSVGGRFCGQSGAVLRPGASWNPAELARRVGLRAMRLRFASISDPALRPYQTDVRAAPFLDLKDGFEAYRAESLASGSRIMRQIEQRMNKAEREVGSMRFEWQSDSDGVFDALLAWKAAQRRRSRSPNLLDLHWARAFVERLRHERDQSFGGVLSALYFGDTLAASHLSIRSRRVLHYLITAYNPDLGRYSPGLVCLVTVARVGSEREGIERIELGIGAERFKQRASNGAKTLADVTVTLTPATRVAFRTVDGVRSWSRQTRAGELVRATGRVLARGSYAARGLLGGLPG